MADLSILTRSAFIKSFRDEVMLDRPVFAMLYDHRRVTWKGGADINQPIIKTSGAAALQWYGVNDGLTVTDRDYLAKATFGWKMAQFSIVYTVEDMIQNVYGGNEEKILDLVGMKVKQSQQDVKEGLDTQLHNTTSAGDSGTKFQSIPEACGHSRTYGTIASNTTTVKYWNGASVAGTYTDVATAMALSLDRIRIIRSACSKYGTQRNRRFYLFMGTALYSKLIGLIEANHVLVAPGKLTKYGLTSIELYGNIEVVEDTWMTDNSMTTHLMFVDPESWELRFHPKRALEMTDFVDQSEQSNGKDQMVARIRLAGNSICWQPNANMYKSLVS